MKRRLKVESDVRENTRSCARYTRQIVPKVRLCGKWLQAAGFEPDTHLELTVISRGVIELRVCGVPRADHEFEIAAMRLDHALAADAARKAVAA